MSAITQECLLCSTELKTQNWIITENCCGNEIHEKCIKNMMWDSPTDSCPICGEKIEVQVRSKAKIHYPETSKMLSSTISMKDEPMEEDGKCYICLDNLTAMPWAKSQICCGGKPKAHLECLQVRNKPKKN